MSTEGSKEQIAYLEAKKQYLAVGKRYSSLLRKVMELDPGILKQAEEILVTGDGLSLHDNRFLTNFYKELKTKSRIDKRYFDYLIELRKVKSQLDVSVHNLSRYRIAYLLRKAGIPSKRTNQGKDDIASQVNSREVAILEKLSLPGVLDVQSSEDLEELVSTGEITLSDGLLIPATKTAKDFVKKLEKNIREKFNDGYLLSGRGDILKQFQGINTSNLLEFIRLSADKEHLREIERKIDAGEISLNRGVLAPLNAKGKKYLSLLLEELSGNLHRNITSELLRRNKTHMELDPRLNNVKKALNDFDISYNKHSFAGRLAPENEIYSSLLARADDNNAEIKKMFTDLIMLQETISTAFADIKKQLVIVVGKSNIDIDKVLTLLVSVRYLSAYENEYENKLSEIENRLNIVSGGTTSLGPTALLKLHEIYGSTLAEPNTDAMISDLVLGKLENRKELGPETNKVLLDFLINSPRVAEYKRILNSETVIKRHLLDLFYGHACLYGGIANLSETLAELTELDLEKREKLADIVEELELAHKELWLARITNNNKQYIEEMYPDIPLSTKEKASGASREALNNARSEVRSTFAKYRASHRAHTDKFAKDLRLALGQLSKGGDIAKTATQLKTKYRDLVTNHEKIVDDMEKEIIELEKRLLDFEEKSPATLEKLLISDIRANI